MVQSSLSSSSSALVALVALTSILSDTATALPTHRSSSAITRRAHIASHYDSPVALVKRTHLGDHSVYVDASTSQPGGTGGVRNSTINLTVVSKRDSTLASFSRVVRSFFRRSLSPSTSSSSSTSRQPVPQLVALPQHTAAPYTKGHRTSRKQHQAAAALSRRSKKQHSKRTLPDHAPPRIGIVVPAKAIAARRPTNVKRHHHQVDKRQANYTVGNEQASIYAAAVAALETSSSAASLSPPQVTAQPVALNAKAAGDLDSIDSEVDSVSYASLPPITVTMTLVPAGPNGEYVDAAGAALPTSTLVSPSSSFSSDSLATPNATLPSSSSLTPTTLAEKLRQRRSTLADRKKRHFEEKRSERVKPSPSKKKEEEDTSRLKRSINPKTGSQSATTTGNPTPASQAQTPQWTEIARF